METYLLKEIAARSDNFFEAAGVVQDLRGATGRTYHQIKDLRYQVGKSACKMGADGNSAQKPRKK